jgi:type II secretory pathway pseudopilin PulG
LLEVVLAIVIAVGMLVVVLYFYQQTSDVRARLLLETERLGAVRLVMDRLTAELRTACAIPTAGGTFVGSASSIQFVKTEVPSRSAWQGAALGRVDTAQTDLRVVRYELSGGFSSEFGSDFGSGEFGSGEFGSGASNRTSSRVSTSFSGGMEEDTSGRNGGASSGGLVRTEEPLVAKRTVASTIGAGESASDINISTAIPASSAMPGSSVTTEASEPKPAPQPLTRVIKYLRFRYYDGSGWRESWSGASLPVGVEVTLGFEVPESEMEWEDFEFGSFFLGSTYSTASTSGTSVQPTATPAAGTQTEEQIPDIFRRIIYLPGSGANEGPAVTMPSSSNSSEPFPEEVMP